MGIVKGRIPVLSKTGKATVAGIALDLAVRALRSEPVQRQLATVPSTVLARLKNRQESAVEPAGTTGTTHRRDLRELRNRVGQAGLERRSRRLRETMGVLANATPDATLATAARRVDTALDGIDRQLLVAGALPLAKRARAQRAIDKDLDALEKALWQSVREGGAFSGS